MAAMTAIPKFPVYAAGLSIALSDQNLKVGDTFTATISVPGGGSSQVALSYDNSVISFDSSSVTSSGGDGEKMISVNGAHAVQPESRSKSPIPTPPAIAPLFLPKIMAQIKRGTFPRWINPPFAVIGSLILINAVNT